ncbi:MAG: hypothetical protein LBP22_17670 [Deltaproteobacteria bacterium]|nr:hypothetical protein [Deltaproteobacteria bacterium]
MIDKHRNYNKASLTGLEMLRTELHETIYAILNDKSAKKFFVLKKKFWQDLCQKCSKITRQAPSRQKRERIKTVTYRIYTRSRKKLDLGLDGGYNHQVGK